MRFLVRRGGHCAAAPDRTLWNSCFGPTDEYKNIHSSLHRSHYFFSLYHLGLPVSTRMPIDGEEGKRGMIERSKRRKNISKKKVLQESAAWGRSCSSQYRFTHPSRRVFSLSPTVGVRGALNGFVPHLSPFPRVLLCFQGFLFWFIFGFIFFCCTLYSEKWSDYSSTKPGISARNRDQTCATQKVKKKKRGKNWNKREKKCEPHVFLYHFLWESAASTF